MHKDKLNIKDIVDKLKEIEKKVLIAQYLPCNV